MPSAFSHFLPVRCDRETTGASARNSHADRVSPLTVVCYPTLHADDDDDDGAQLEREENRSVGRSSSTQLHLHTRCACVCVCDWGRAPRDLASPGSARQSIIVRRRAERELSPLAHAARRRNENLHCRRVDRFAPCAIKERDGVISSDQLLGSLPIETIEFCARTRRCGEAMSRMLQGVAL